MNKHFFQMKSKVLLSDILNDLNVSNHIFLNINSKFDENILKSSTKASASLVKSLENHCLIEIMAVQILSLFLV